jgi:hypothetical protein
MPRLGVEIALAVEFDEGAVVAWSAGSDCGGAVVGPGEDVEVREGAGSLGGEEPMGCVVLAVLAVFAVLAVAVASLGAGCREAGGLGLVVGEGVMDVRDLVGGGFAEEAVGEAGDFHQFLWRMRSWEFRLPGNFDLDERCDQRSVLIVDPSEWRVG